MTVNSFCTAWYCPGNNEWQFRPVGGGVISAFGAGESQCGNPIGSELV